MTTIEPNPTRPLSVVPCDHPDRSGPAALATVACHHGLSLRPEDVGSLLGLPAPTALGDLLVAARLLGFDSVPLEGSYDDLPDLELPAIVVLRGPETGDGGVRFAVLHAMDAASVLVADPLEGAVRRVLREEFCARWTGDCLRVVPLEEQLARTRERLALHRSPAKRLAAWLRFAPPRAPKLLFLVAALGLPALAAAASDGALPAIGAALALSIAAVSSLWLVLFGASCARCGAAHWLAGALPLDRAGAVLYASLLAMSLAVPANPLPAYALLVAAGAHASLLVLLARARTMCVPCVLTALSAFVAAALTVPAAGVSVVIAGALLALAFAGMLTAVRFFRRAAEHAGLWEARRLAREALGRGAAPDGTVRVVVWKRSGCPNCLIYEAAIKPALVEELGETVAFEEHDAGRLPVPVPLILVAGPVPVLFVGLPQTDDDQGAIRLAIESARNPASAALAPLGGIHIVEAPRRS